jgi:hypothetical protein
VVATDVEEGATVAEAILEAGEVVTDAVKGAEPPDKAGGDLLTKGRWGIPAGTSLQSLPQVAPWWAPTIVVF